MGEASRDHAQVPERGVAAAREGDLFGHAGQPRRDAVGPQLHGEERRLRSDLPAAEAGRALRSDAAGVRSREHRAAHQGERRVREQSAQGPAAHSARRARARGFVRRFTRCRSTRRACRSA